MNPRRTLAGGVGKFLHTSSLGWTVRHTQVSSWRPVVSSLFPTCKELAGRGYTFTLGAQHPTLRASEVLTSWDLQTPDHTHTLRQGLHCQRTDTDSVPQGSSQDVARSHTDLEFRDILRLFARRWVSLHPFSSLDWGL